MVTSLERIRVVIGDAGDSQLEAEAELFDDLCPVTVSAILGALPITGIVSRWGDEIYFSTSVIAPEENQKELVEIGDLGYWRRRKHSASSLDRLWQARGTRSTLQALSTSLGGLSEMLPFLSGFPKARGL